MALAFSCVLQAKDIEDRIRDMQIKFVSCVEANDSEGAYNVADSLKTFALQNNRLKAYYYCFNNLVKMECLRGRYHEAIHISQDLLADIQERKAYDHMVEYHKCMSTIHTARGDLKQSLECLMKAKEKSQGDDKNIYIRLATLLIDMKKPQEAIEWAEKAEKEAEAEVIRSNGIYYKMYAYFKMEQKDSFDVYYKKFTDIAKMGQVSPEHMAYLPFLRNFMDGKYKEALESASEVKQEKDRLEFMIQAYHRLNDFTHAFELQSKYIKLKDSINESIVHEDLLALNHSSEIAEKNNELAKHRYTNMVLVIVLAVIIIACSTVFNVIRYRYTQKLKLQNAQLSDALDEVRKSARIKRAMIEDVKEKSKQPIDILRTYSKAIVTPDFSLQIDENSNVLNNIRKSTEALRLLLDPIVNMYKNDEQAQSVTVNGNTQIENGKAMLINTIASLSGFIDIIESADYNLPATEKKSIMEQMHIDMKDIAMTFDTMLDMVYYDNCESLPLTDKVSVNELCNTVVNEFIQRHKDNVQLLFNTSADNSVCTATYYTALYKMLRYTIDNADKFTSSGSITVNCTTNGKQAIVSVADTGCGIDKEDRENIFKRFFKSESKYHGIGLGLPICRRIGMLIGCEITLDQSYSQGSKFDITIPII